MNEACNYVADPGTAKGKSAHLLIDAVSRHNA